MRSRHLNSYDPGFESKREKAQEIPTNNPRKVFRRGRTSNLWFKYNLDSGMPAALVGSSDRLPRYARERALKMGIKL